MTREQFDALADTLADQIDRHLLAVFNSDGNVWLTTLGGQADLAKVIAVITKINPQDVTEFLAAAKSGGHTIN